MRLIAKASATGSTLGHGTVRARRALGVSLALAALTLLGLTAATASATKYAKGFIGSTSAGTTGGLFDKPEDVAVNDEGVGGVPAGTFYVVDDNNHRIQRFDADGDFVSAWGADVVVPGGAGDIQVNERQTVTINGAPTGGTFTMRLGAAATQTAPIAFNASPAEFQAGLETSSAIGAGNVSVTSPNPGGGAVAGGPYAVEFVGALANTDVSQLSGQAGGLTPSGSIAVATTTVGGLAFEVCTEAADCKAGSANFEDDGGLDNPQGVAVDQDTGDVYVSDRDNRRIDQYTATGDFIRAFGTDVVASGPGDLPATEEDVNELRTLELLSVNGAVVGGSFTLIETTGTGNGTISAGSNTVTGVSSSFGSFHIGDAFTVGGPTTGIPPETTITAVEPGLLTLSNAATLSGSRSLTAKETTANIPYNATAEELEAALEALPGIGAGNVAVNSESPGGGSEAGGPWVWEYVGALAAIDIPNTGGGSTGLEVTGLTKSLIFGNTVRQGGHFVLPAYEICEPASGAVCKAGVGRNFGSPGQYGNTTTDGGYRLDVSKPDGNPSSGSVFLANTGSRRVEAYDLDGASPTNLGSGSFANNRPLGVAVDSTGTVYADTQEGEKVQFGSPIARLELGGSPPLASIDIVGLGGEIGFTQGLEVAQASEHLLVARKQVLELDAPAADPSIVDRHFDSPLVLQGLGVNGVNGDLFVVPSTTGSGGHRVFLLDDAGLAVQSTVTLDPPANVGAHSADVQGTVNPNGTADFPSSYVFQTSRNGVVWSPEGPLTGVGGGSTPVPVAAALTGLEACVGYRVRILTKKTANPPVGSAEQPLATDCVPPEVKTLAAQAHTDTAARLVGRLNPNNLATSYRFEYGRTIAYGSSAPLPDGAASGGQERLVLAEVDGLEPETTYHYRLVATNSEGTTKGADVKFTTGPPLSPPGDRAYEMLTPPFKVSPSAAAFRADPIPAIPSPDGERVLWGTKVFPLTEGQEFPFGGDRLLIERKPGGWSSRSLLDQQPLYGSKAGVAKTLAVNAASADLLTQTWASGLPLLPVEGAQKNYAYTRSDKYGWASWLTNPDAQSVAQGFSLLSSGGPPDQALLNDDGSAMVRWGNYRGLLGDEPAADPSLAQLAGNAGGAALYRQVDSPSGALDLVGGCTGSTVGGDATQIPSRTEAGTIGERPCQEDTGQLASGSAKRTAGSATLSEVAPDGGAFEVGQIAFGEGVPPGARIAAVDSGAETITLSTPVTCGQAEGIATLNIGSSVLTDVRATCGAFQVGQVVTSSSSALPVGATIAAISGDSITLSAATSNPSSRREKISVAGSGTVVDLSGREQAIVSLRGAALTTPAATAMSDDGRRVFFAAPDPAATGAPATCGVGTGVATDCPPQLYVRQYGSAGGDPVVRWISRSRSNPLGEDRYGGVPIAGQSIGLLARATFEGASRSGDVVYFRTATPLTPDDPSNSSVDLYRYELPVGLDQDPAGGALTRVSGGPGGGADPGLSSTRFISDDGQRAYFVADAPLAGADSTPPKAGVTEPGAGGNLYLFDAAASGAARYRFIARVEGCAASGSSTGAAIQRRNGALNLVDGNCVRGVPDGRTIAFQTAAQLTGDDDDAAEDVYVYDARGDELMRASAPPPGAESYVCDESPLIECNADLGWGSEIGGYDYDKVRGWGGGRSYNIATDASGAVSVFFESRSELVPGDVNGEYWDVYEWREGKLSLVSPGDAQANAFYSGNSLDGQDVFFQTPQRIDPREVSDSDFDVYDARVGGGFAFTSPPPECDVLAHGCRGSVGAAPPTTPPASVAARSEGNVAPAPTRKRCGKGKVRRRGRCTKVAKRHRRCSKGKAAGRRKARGKGRCVRHAAKRNATRTGRTTR